MFGGNLDFESGPTGWKGLNKVYTFDPFTTRQWDEQPDMAHGPLVPDRGADGRRPHPDHERSGRERHQQDGRGRGGVHPGPTRGGTGTISLIGQTSDTVPGLPPTGGYYPHMFAMPSGRAFVVGPQQHQTWFMKS